jgi:hypothetical protein
MLVLLPLHPRILQIPLGVAPVAVAVAVVPVVAAAVVVAESAESVVHVAPVEVEGDLRLHTVVALADVPLAVHQGEHRRTDPSDQETRTCCPSSFVTALENRYDLPIA